MQNEPQRKPMERNERKKDNLLQRFDFEIVVGDLIYRNKPKYLELVIDSTKTNYTTYNPEYGVTYYSKLGIQLNLVRYN